MIRVANDTDFEQIYKVECACFDIKERASKDVLKARFLAYPEYFLVYEQAGKVIGYVAGACSTQEHLLDAMYTDVSMHDVGGDTQFLFSVCVLKIYRNQGVAKALLLACMKKATKEKRRRIVLTCKASLVPFYEKVGFINTGLSGSQHGGVSWFEMVYTIKKDETF